MTPEEERDLLLRVVTQLAAARLGENALMPFGATLKPPRDVKILMPKSMKQDVTMEELGAYWARELRKSAEAENSKTLSFCAEVQYKKDSGDMAPAVLVHIEYAGVYSANFICPYRKEPDSRVVFAEPLVEQSEYRVFASAPDEAPGSAVN